jgi:hypothetical protein
MPEAVNSIPGRQRTEDLFTAPVGTPGNPVFLEAGETVLLPPAAPDGQECGREIAGYAVESFFIVSDQPFSVAVFESCHCCGPWVQTETLVSAVVDGQNLLSTRLAANSKFMRLEITNTGPEAQTAFDVCVFGIPIATAGA